MPILSSRHTRRISSILSIPVLLLFATTQALAYGGQQQRAEPLLCTIRPLGPGLDDTDQVLGAVSRCGRGGQIVLQGGAYNITRKMTWELVDARVDLQGMLSFKPDVEYWLRPENTYRVVFIQNQASWFVVTGSNFEIDAHGVGGIEGNGQPWWIYFTTHAKADGDGRPIALTLSNATNGRIRDFAIRRPPFWANTIANSRDVVYEGMYVNATNEAAGYEGRNIVPNTDGICTYRSDNITLINWDVTCGDDCLAIKGNSTNLTAKNVTCRGGNGIAFGSLGQYANQDDNVENVVFEDLRIVRIDSSVQPNMANGVYFKSWTGSVSGSPPTGGGGGGGTVKNVTIKNVVLDRVNIPIHLYQTNGGHSGDVASQLRFGDLAFLNWTGNAATNKIVDIECSPAVGCGKVVFDDFEVSGPVGQTARYICQNVDSVAGISCS